MATIANGLGSGYRRPMKPEKLWTPNLVQPKPAPKRAATTAEEKAAEAAREAERKRKQKAKAMRIAAGLPPVGPSKKR